MMRSAGLAAAFLAFAGNCVLAHGAKPLGSYESWSTWMLQRKNSKTCYIYSDAQSKEPETLDHGRVSFFIRRLDHGTVRSEASLQAGYAFGPTAIRVVVDKKPFTMLARGRNAWLRREGREAEFLRALIHGRMMSVEALSSRGNKTSYRFSLTGVAAAMRKARQICP